MTWYVIIRRGDRTTAIGPFRSRIEAAAEAKKHRGAFVAGQHLRVKL